VKRQRWVKRGLLLEPPFEQAWAHSHAALPFLDQRGDGSARIYFSPRDVQGRARVARAGVDLESGRVLSVDPDPVIDLGPLGAFDDSGATCSCLLRDDRGIEHLYYTGWTLARSVPFLLFAGSTVSTDEGATFVKRSRAPLLERNDEDPLVTASPWVLIDNGVWRMWYVSGIGWIRSGGDVRHSYLIKYAESADGITWARRGVAIDLADDAEYAHGRPCVVRDGDRYRMWFCARGERYRLAYAESRDGLEWERKDSEVQLLGDTDWDREMQAYPSVHSVHGRRWLLYNGDGYGRTGVGYATEESE
jgi:hypothetical protein